MCFLMSIVEFFHKLTFKKHWYRQNRAYCVNKKTSKAECFLKYRALKEYGAPKGTQK